MYAIQKYTGDFVCIIVVLSFHVDGWSFFHLIVFYMRYRFLIAFVFECVCLCIGEQNIHTFDQIEQYWYICIAAIYLDRLTDYSVRDKETEI